MKKDTQLLKNENKKGKIKKDTQLLKSEESTTCIHF